MWTYLPRIHIDFTRSKQENTHITNLPKKKDKKWKVKNPCGIKNHSY